MRSIVESDVDSSAISRIGYDEERRELYVRYRGGDAYTYLDVPPEEYLALCEAESKGTFVNRVIKARYDFREGGPV